MIDVGVLVTPDSSAPAGPRPLAPAAAAPLLARCLPAAARAV